MPNDTINTEGAKKNSSGILQWLIIFSYRIQRRNNPKWRLDENMGRAIWTSLKDKKSGKEWEYFVEYNLDQLINHLEKKFESKLPALVYVLADTKIINGHDAQKIRQALKGGEKGIPNLIIAETKSDQLPFLMGLDAHYYLMTDDDYRVAMNILS